MKILKTSKQLLKDYMRAETLTEQNEILSKQVDLFKEASIDDKKEILKTALGYGIDKLFQKGENK